MSLAARVHHGRTPSNPPRSPARRRVVLLGFVVLFSHQSITVPAYAAQPVVNVAEVASSGGTSSPPTVVSSNPVVTEIAAVPLVVSKEVAPSGIVQPGDTLRYTLHFANPSGATLTNVVLVDPLDPLIADATGVTTGSVADIGSGSGTIPLTGAWDSLAREIRWTIPALGPGSAGSVSFSARLDSGASGESTVTNAFVARSDQDPNGIASAPVTSTMVAPALALYLTAGRDRVQVGDVIPFDLRLSNTDPVLDLSGASIELRLPRGFRYVDGSLSAGGTRLAGASLSGRGRTL
ncbi:MAG TPA: hypothetical protein VNI57_14600, partial [Candidatus Saccharimonadales bacterium]|nr:hypothetical protein [Candidatus Saccharimonadales bacterium]